MYKIVIASLLAAYTAFTQQTSTTTVWGGDHVELQVHANDAAVDFDCAHGTIDGPLKADSNGQFEIAGTFTPEHAGPIREDSSQTRQATYTGTIKEETMTLRVTVTGEGAPAPMTFSLTRGRDGTVRKCR